MSTLKTLRLLASRKVAGFPCAVVGLAVVVVLSILFMFSYQDALAVGYSIRSTPPRYVFVDLGANVGDSCLMFLQDPEAPEKFDFPTPPGKKHSDAEIFLFEANPTFNTDLVDLKQKLKHRGININIFPSTPVWTESKLMTFHIDLRDRHAAGSSLLADHPSVVQSDKAVNLTSVAISQWLLQNFLPEDFVVVKMDIELAEYSIVSHMAAMGVGRVLDYMFVEWHHWIIDAADPRVAKSAEAVRQLEAEGVRFPTYNTMTKKRKRSV
ncbi:hypothetical protein HK105_204330 [Polyrhizophydium stewartii]|uniref:Methyltransferase FkbM domain-containing protein n=1 Tax=Polyrhizophydium stewartii TaxID=2732419 RepID=A0ABR4N9Q1_9FUNG